MNKYYAPMSKACFRELKEKCIELWPEISSNRDYVRETINRIKGLENVRDNGMFMVALFDISNQIKLSKKLSLDTRTEIWERLVAGGAPEDHLLIFI
jgi:hypothetical protein